MQIQQLPSKPEVDQIAARFAKCYTEDPMRFNILPGRTTNWSPEKLVKLYQFATDPDATQQELAEALNIDRSGVSRKANSMNWTSFHATLNKLCNMSPEQALDFESDQKLVRDTENQKVKDRKTTVTKQAFLKNLEAKIIEATKHIQIRSTPVPVKNSPKHISSPEHVVLLLSDLHVGLEFSKAETGGINEYNLDIFQRRLKNLQRGIASIYDIHKQAYTLPEIHIFGLGDMVQGGNLNGEWGPAYVSVHVAKQAAIAAAAMAELVKFCAQLFNKVHFVGVIGNHGRGGVSKNSDAIGANWDNVSYIILKSLFEKDPRVKIDCDQDTWWACRNILGTEFVLEHGDHISGRSNALKANNQAIQDIVSKQTGKHFNVLCLGHYHSFQEMETTTGRILVNGSFVGSDMYSLQHMHSGGRPTQTIFGVHPEHGVTWKYNIDLEVKPHNAS
jgi:hypothetical protein